MMERPMSLKQYVYEAFLDPYEKNASIVDLLPPDMLPLIHDHWYGYPPIKSIWHIVLGLVIIILGIISISGNGLVLYLMATVRSLRTPSNLLVMNLAFSDFCMLAYMMPAMAPNAFKETWVTGYLHCQVYGMLGSLFGCVSVWSLVMITMDRYNVIVRGMNATPLTRVRAVLKIAFIWTWSIGWTILPFYGWSRYVPEGSMTSCTIDYISTDFNSLSYLIIYATAVYMIPLFTLIYCYTFIVFQVANHEKQLKDQAKKMNVTSLRANSDSSKTNAEYKLAMVALTTVVLWFIAWTPYLMLAIGGVFTDRTYVTPLTTVWGAVFGKASACYNPIVYGISHPKYKAALYSKFKSCNNTPVDDSRSEVNTISSEQ
ncbi:ocellar opsin [Parasteatoda tepidariorum]|uniref:ocellar opsin n=1 Tax=Parasteatoda tepidariorum TaxID=114398 RepID=UPI00077F9233|nr:ocellar opsin [Parasteatoda tepidariorum]